MFIYGGNDSAAARAAASAARDAISEAERARSGVHDLEERLERLALATEALWTIVKQRLGTDDEALAKEMEALDLSDGARDGRVRRAATACPSCGRTVGARHSACLYCRARLPRPPMR